MIGQRFKRLTVIATAAPYREPNGTRRVRWLCRCDCGNEVVVHESNARKGTTGSCGCLQRERTSAANRRHGYTRNGQKPRVYRVWEAMHRRCGNPKDTHFKDYGGRGISVCSRWVKFENFLADMGEPKGDLFIDRVNNDGNYEPSNCKWRTLKDQARNRRSNRVVEYRGRKMCLTEAIELSGVPRSTAKDRLTRGLSIEQALSR